MKSQYFDLKLSLFPFLCFLFLFSRSTNGQEKVDYVPALACQTSLENAAKVKDAGGTYIGLSVAGWLDPDGPDEEFKSKLEKLQQAALPVEICNSFIRRKDLHANGPEANHDEILIYVEKAFQRAQQAGVKMINFGSSGARRLPEGFSNEEGMEQFVSLLKKIAPLAQKYDVTVGVEQLQSRECNFITRLAEVERVVRETNHPNIKAVADFYHMAAEGDTPEDLARITDILMHVEIAELEGRTMPGVNGQDFRPFLKVLKEAGYKGALSIEGRFKVEELHKGFAELKKQWEES